MSQKWYISHAETLTQNVIGLAVGFIILKWWGLSVSESFTLQAVIFITSYLRSYIIRRFFNYLGSAKSFKPSDIPEAVLEHFEKEEKMIIATTGQGYQPSKKPIGSCTCKCCALVCPKNVKTPPKKP